jgi:hypothetical protein
MKIKSHEIKELYTPQRLIYNNTIFKITTFVDKFVIRGYTIQTVDGLIDTVYLDVPHPNAEPSTGEFCIPHELRQHTINKQTLEIIGSMLCCFNLDDCYFTPWDEINYKKI